MTFKSKKIKKVGRKIKKELVLDSKKLKRFADEGLTIGKFKKRLGIKSKGR